MKNKNLWAALLVCSLSLNLVQFYINGSTRYPAGLNEVVPDAETAIKIAESVWFPIYGDNLNSSRPFKAEYIENQKIWFVYGTLPEDFVGGVPEICIRRKDGKITRITHGM